MIKCECCNNEILIIHKNLRKNLNKQEGYTLCGGCRRKKLIEVQNK